MPSQTDIIEDCELPEEGVNQVEHIEHIDHVEHVQHVDHVEHIEQVEQDPAEGGVDIVDEPSGVVSADVDTDATSTPIKSPSGLIRKRRVCKFPGCHNTVKSQGHCQKHGARPKRCKVPQCLNQAQGSHDGYCKRHWREHAAPPDKRKIPKKFKDEPVSVDPSGDSVYDEILPASFAWKACAPKTTTKVKKVTPGPKADGDDGEDDNAASEMPFRTKYKEHVEKYKYSDIIPIAQHFADNAHLQGGWHRKAERLARGIGPPKSLSAQLDPWEKQLAILELALITGTDIQPRDSARAHRQLAHGWGREKGFHKIMLEQLCGRRGDLERKKRNDSGRKYTDEKKVAYRAKYENTRSKKKRKVDWAEEAVKVEGVGETSGDVKVDPFTEAVEAAMEDEDGDNVKVEEEEEEEEHTDVDDHQNHSFPTIGGDILEDAAEV